MPFSSIYGKVLELRARLFERGVMKSHALGAPTVSIGNITVGGTGKTPLVAFVASILLGCGERVCVISRGYKRSDPGRRVIVCDGRSILSDAASGGDEPVELANALGAKAIVIADPDRVSAARFAIENFGATAFVLDDAFQHLQARRDADIVLIDATNPFGNGRTLPGGILREPLGGLGRADLVIITRANLVDSATIDEIRAKIANHCECPIVIARNRFKSFRLLSGGPSGDLGDRSIHAFCAIGNPSNFFDQLRAEGLRVAGETSFADHHYYSQKDIDLLENTARNAGADALVTTAKDAVKLEAINLAMPCFVAENEFVLDDETPLMKLLSEITSG